MSNLARVDGAALARQDDGLTQEQVDLIKRTIAKGASNDELAMFLGTAKRLRLDPFARQIFLVRRWDNSVKGFVAQPQVSVDGLRLVAERTGEYRGQTDAEWCGKDGKWTDVWLADEPPAAARVGVYRAGFEKPLVRVALYKSYVQVTKDKQTGDERPNAMWAKYPEVMLAKCAESLAIRAAFPNETSGVYTVEELPPDPETPAKAERQAKPVRSLDDVASAGGETQRPLPEQTTPAPTQTATPHGHGAETTDVIDAETGEVDPEPEWPTSKCPVFQSGVDVGKSYMDVSAHKMQALLDTKKFLDAASSAQLEWAKFRVRHRAWEKRNGINVKDGESNG